MAPSSNRASALELRRRPERRAHAAIQLVEIRRRHAPTGNDSRDYTFGGGVLGPCPRPFTVKHFDECPKRHQYRIIYDSRWVKCLWLAKNHVV